MSSTILAIDTATEQCSVALTTPNEIIERVVPTQRGHADMILTLVDEVLRQGRTSLGELDALAYGRGPGSFTGVRIAVGVIQGLAFAANKPTIGISNLAAVAQRAVNEQAIGVGKRVLVCMDARMQEAYWGVYVVMPDGLVQLVDQESVAPPDAIQVDSSTIAYGVGTAWRAYTSLRDRYTQFTIDETLLPRAAEVAKLARRDLEAGHQVVASRAEPVYLRDEVAKPKQDR